MCADSTRSAISVAADTVRSYTHLLQHAEGLRRQLLGTIPSGVPGQHEAFDGHVHVVGPVLEEPVVGIE